MKNIIENDEHPNPMDRNRAILWARDLLQFKEWVLISVKVSRLKTVSIDECSELISIGVVGPENNALLDVLVRPNKAVSTELLKIHGCDQGKAFEAPTFDAIYKILNAGMSKTPVVAWAPHQVQAILDQLCKANGLPNLNARWMNAQVEYSKFVGELEDTGGYYMRPVPRSANPLPESPTLAECQQILEVVHAIAASSQISDSALTFNKNWSAAFYKPRLGPTARIREILGFPPTT